MNFIEQILVFLFQVFLCFLKSYFASGRVSLYLNAKAHKCGIEFRIQVIRRERHPVPASTALAPDIFGRDRTLFTLRVVYRPTGCFLNMFIGKFWISDTV